jgi:calcineurin-like phosphoesterase family protein
MNEKLAVNDLLSCLNSVSNKLTFGIQESDNEQFRQTLIDARTKFDELKWDTYLIAKEKGYYVPAAPAGEADIEQVKSAISQ